MELNKATQNFKNRPLAERMELQLDLFEDFVKTRVGFGTLAFETRWKVRGILDWFTPAEAATFLDEIKDLEVSGVRVIDIDTVIDDEGSVLEIQFNLVEVS